MLAPPVPPALRVLSNPMNRALILALESGPSYPRELANRIGVTEGQAQKHLRLLESAGLLDSAWHHEEKTVKLYRLRAESLRVDFQDGIGARVVTVRVP